MQVNVNAALGGKVKKNFWNNVHFHPTDAVEDVWGQEVLTKFAEQKCAQYLRLYSMFEDVVSRDENGNLVFDFSEQDKRFDIPAIGLNTLKTMARHGAKILAVEANETIIVDQKKVIEFADKKGIIVMAV